MVLGPLLVDIAGVTLTPGDRDILQHPLVGGVLLFSRNYDNPAQLAELTASIRAVRDPALLVIVDQEGGRVQRFRDGFTRLPAPRLIGEVYTRDRDAGIALAQSSGWIMAAELGAVGIDVSLAPVVDIDDGASRVIGDRAFHRDAHAVAELAVAWAQGAHDAGMASVAKHCPGHGSVALDSHVDSVVDARRYEAIVATSLQPFRRMVDANIEGVMMSHVIYSAVDSQPASLSRRWITDVIRNELQFQGAVLGDDLSMQAASMRGDVVSVVEQSFAAGCDMSPLCNNRLAVERVLDQCHVSTDPESPVRLERLRGHAHANRTTLLASAQWRAAEREIRRHIKLN